MLTPEATPTTPAALDFDPVALRLRIDGWTIDRQRAFLEILADCGIVRHAAAEVGMSEQSVTRLRRRAGAHSFDVACDAALRMGARRLRAIAFERAVEGQVKRHYYHGELVSEERVFDNRLLICLLGKHRHLFSDGAEVARAERDWDKQLGSLVDGETLDDPTAPPRVVIQPLGAEFNGDEDIWRDDDSGEWHTSLPPPKGFAGIEYGDPGDECYDRALSAEEEEVVEARMAAELAPQIARRNAFFALPAAPFSPQGPEPSTPSAAATPSAPP